MGASGSGKTTLLNCISTIDTVSAGHIYLGGTDVTEIKPKAIARFRRENLGFVFQDFNLLDTLTISENIALALSINKTPARDVEPRIQDIAQKLNITDILNKYPYQVSGGQKRCCACARQLSIIPNCFWQMNQPVRWIVIQRKCSCLRSEHQRTTWCDDSYGDA